MKIGDPAELFGQLDKEDISKFRERFGDVKRLLKPEDSFRFECDKSGKCCKNRFDNPIALSPYDIARLRKNLKISSGEFLKRHAIIVLGEDSHLPIALLKYRETGNDRNKCPFLRSYGCSVYDDRPLRCRLYPLGRAVDLKGVSYFFLMDTPSYCGVDKGRSYTLEEWLKESKVEPFIEWSDRFFEIIFKIDHQKYRSLDPMIKLSLGKMMYDFDGLVRKLADSKLIPQPDGDEEVLSTALTATKLLFQEVLQGLEDAKK